jgi:hypothetical protein
VSYIESMKESSRIDQINIPEILRFFGVMHLRQGACMIGAIACILITHLGDQLLLFKFLNSMLSSDQVAFKNIRKKNNGI